MFETISSPANAFVRELKRLNSAKSRRARGGEMVLEGITLVREAFESGLEIGALVCAESFDIASSGLFESGEQLGVAIEAIPGDFRRVRVPDALFRELSSLTTSPGLLAVSKRPTLSLAGAYSQGEASRDQDPIVVATDLQDPGNLGALSRTAEAARCRGLVLCGESVDPYSPKSLRGSMGSLVRLPVVDVVEADGVSSTIRFLRGMERALIGTSPKDGEDYRELDWTRPFALFIGGESQGLSTEILDRMDTRVTIPMPSLVDSLNVSVAAAVILFHSLHLRER